MKALIFSFLVIFAMIATLFIINEGKRETKYDPYLEIHRGGVVSQVIQKIENADKIHIDGPCISACTMVLFPKYKDKVTWTDDSLFMLHAVRYTSSNRIARKATAQYFAALPVNLQKILPNPCSWGNQLFAISGKDMRSILKDRHPQNHHL